MQMSAHSPSAERPPRLPLLAPLLSFILGILVAEVLPMTRFPDWELVTLVTLSLVMTLSLQARAARWCLLASALLLGATAMPPAEPAESPHAPGFDSRTAVRLEGQVLEIQRLAGNRSSLILESHRQCTREGCAPVTGKVKVYVEGPPPTPGWIIRCAVRLSRFEPSGNPGAPDPRVQAAREEILRRGSLTSAGWVQLQPTHEQQPDQPVTALLTTVAPRFFATREQVRARLRAYYLQAPADVRGLLLGLVLGERTELEEGQKEAFSSAGLAHLLAISGSHFALIASGAGAILAWPMLLLPGINRRLSARSVAARMAMFPTVLYALLVGISASIGRAVIMSCLVLALASAGRKVAGLALLILAGWIVLSLEPAALWDIGCQLSFASVLALMTLSTKLQHSAEAGIRLLLGLVSPRIPWLSHLAGPLKALALLLTTSAAATVGTAPLCAFHFGSVPWAGILANVLAVPLLGAFSLPPLLLGGMLHLLELPGAQTARDLATWVVRPGLSVADYFGDASRFTPLLWQPSILQTGALGIAALGLCFPDELRTMPAWLRKVLKPLNASPGAHSMDTAWILTAMIQGLYKMRVSVFGVVLLLGIQTGEGTASALPGGVEQWMASPENPWMRLSGTPNQAPAPPLPAGKPSPRPLRYTQLNVGQGDGAVVELPSGEWMVVDAGGATGASTADPGKRVVLPFLRDKAIQHLDIMVLTHPHPDHMGGLLALAEAYPVRELWISERPDREGDFQALVTLLESRGTRVLELDTTVELPPRGGVQMRCLHPSPGWKEKVRRKKDRSVNNTSLVLELSYGEEDLLLTGDIEEAVEELLATEDRLRTVEVVKVPHHGSNTSSTPALVEATRPQVAVMGVGRENRFDFPRTSVVRRWASQGAQIFRTDQDGAVELTIWPQSLQVRTWHPDRLRTLMLAAHTEPDRLAVLSLPPRSEIRGHWARHEERP